MKKLLSTALFSLVIPATIFSCGGGGGGSSSDTTITSQTQTTTAEQAEPAVYYGAASQGDLAKFVFDGQKVQYEVKGPVFGDKKGEFEVEVYHQKPFYKAKDDEIYLMFSGNLAFADVYLDNGETVVVGLKSAGQLKDEDVADKKFVYTAVLTDGTVEAYTIDFSKDHTWELYNLAGELENKGTWQIAGDGYIEAKDEDGNLYNVVVKPGESRAGFVVDLASYGGFGIGLEQKSLTEKDITGTYSFYSYEPEYDEDCFGTVKLYYDTATKTYKYEAKTTWCDDPEDIGYTEKGTVTPNSPIDGMLKVTSDEGETGYAFIDPEDGYFIFVGINPETSKVVSYVIGTNKY
jgi:hypothetical protein